MTAGIYNATIDQGSVWSVIFVYKDPNDNPINLNGYTAAMQLRQVYDSTTADLTLTTGNGGISIVGATGTITVTATYGATTYPIFSGFITSYVNTQPKDATEVAYTTIQAVDASRLANNAQITTVAGATAGDLSGTRVNQILDQIDWPATMRDIDAGLTTLQNDPGTLRTSLGAMQVVAQSEYGALYVDANGEFVFQDRAVTAGSIGGTVTTFNDNGTGIAYANANWKLDDTLVFNSSTVTRLGGGCGRDGKPLGQPRARCVSLR